MTSYHSLIMFSTDMKSNHNQLTQTLFNVTRVVVYEWLLRDAAVDGAMTTQR